MKKRKNNWRGDDLRLLKSLLPFLTDKEIAKVFGISDRTLNVVKQKYSLTRDNSQLKTLTKNIPIIVIKDLDRFDEDRLKLDELVLDRLKNG